MSLNVFFVVWGFGLIVFNSAVFIMKGFNYIYKMTQSLIKWYGNLDVWKKELLYVFLSILFCVNCSGLAYYVGNIPHPSLLNLLEFLSLIVFAIGSGVFACGWFVSLTCEE